jgi:hypothetical protein
VATFLLAGAFGLLQLVEAAQVNKANPKDGPAKVGADTPVLPPAALKMTFASKDADVREMASVINSKLEASWKANKITPSAWVDDYEFLRRASLDIIGRIAKPEEIRVYLKDPPELRRSNLIERLLKHEDYARHWANLWSNWLLTRSGPFGRGMYKDQMTIWLEDQFAQNKSYSELVTKLLTAKGKNTDPNNGAVNFILAHVGERISNTPDNGNRIREEGYFEMVPVTSRLTRLFLGTQVQCAQCHPHPFFNGLKQEHFWGVNAFLRQVRREGNPVMMRNMLPTAPLTLIDDETVNADAKVFFETRANKFRYQKAQFIPAPGKEFGPALDPKLKGVARREELAKYLVDHEMFSRAIVNRMWGIFFGRGFVNPVDDFNDNNQVANPELLEELSARFKHYNYDLKKLIRWMTHANAYHLSYVANKTNDKAEHETQFSRMIMKSISPEQLFESLMVATKAEQSETAEAKKKLRDSWLGKLISNFGDDEGNEVNFNGTIVQALMMMNGEDINKAIARPDKGTVALAMRNSGAPDRIINDLYLATLNRPPRRTELALIKERMRLRAGFKDTIEGPYQDLFWALLNSNEFLLNH